MESNIFPFSFYIMQIYEYRNLRIYIPNISTRIKDIATFVIGKGKSFRCSEE